jgi:hypothetical protein
MKQLPAVHENIPQYQHVYEACVIEEMVVGNDGHQVFVSTTGAPLIVKKMGAGSRAYNSPALFRMRHSCLI